MNTRNQSTVSLVIAPPSRRVARLARLLNRRANLSTEYVRYLGKLAETGEPSAAPVIAEFLDMPGMVGRHAAQCLLRLSWSSSECLQAVLATCEELVESSLDSDVIRNASQVRGALVRRIPMRNAA